MSRPELVEHMVGTFRLVAAVNSAARCDTWVYAPGALKPFHSAPVHWADPAARQSFIAAHLPPDIQSIADLELVEFSSKIGAAKARGPRDSEGKNQDALPYEATEPSEREQDGRLLFADLLTEIRRYVWLGKSEAIAVALWILLTHALDAFDETPYVHVQAPEKRCGKTTLLEVLAGLCARAVRVSSMSVSFLFRALDAYKLTLLIDEVGAWLDGPNVGELRGVLNDGSKRNGKVGRTEKRTKNGTEEFHPTYYCVFGPKAFSGYGKSLPDDTLDRCIPIKLARADDEARKTLAKLRSRRFGADARALRARCARWAQDHLESLRVAHVVFPPGLTGRQEDIWEPLLSIASELGDEALRDAREAVGALTGTRSLSLGERLLEDLLLIFVPDPPAPSEPLPTPRVFVPTTELVSTLIEGDREEWRALPDTGKPLTPEMIASLLKPYEVASIRDLGPDRRRVRGYTAAALIPSWSGYLETPDASARVARFPRPTKQLDALETVDETDKVDGMDGIRERGEEETADGVITYSDGSTELTAEREADELAKRRVKHAARGGA